MTAVLDHSPKAWPAGPHNKSCCNPRPWHPICVDCPGRFRTTSTNLKVPSEEGSVDSEG